MKCLFLLVLFTVAAGLVGCQSQEQSLYSFGYGMVDTLQQREFGRANVLQYNALQFADDSDLLWMVDKPSSLTYWSLRGTGRGATTTSGRPSMITYEPPRW